MKIIHYFYLKTSVCKLNDISYNLYFQSTPIIQLKNNYKYIFLASSQLYCYHNIILMYLCFNYSAIAASLSTYKLYYIIYRLYFTK